MAFKFKIIEKDAIQTVIPLIEELNEYRISYEVLEVRLKDMINQNYECAGVYDGEMLIGISGLWFCTRHYSGKSVELDHVFINNAYRGVGLGKDFFAWIYNYVSLKGCESVELNTSLLVMLLLINFISMKILKF